MFCGVFENTITFVHAYVSSLVFVIQQILFMTSYLMQIDSSTMNAIENTCSIKYTIKRSIIVIEFAIRFFYGDLLFIFLN